MKKEIIEYMNTQGIDMASRHVEDSCAQRMAKNRARSGRDLGSMLVFDFETIPDYDHKDLFNLPKVREYDPAEYDLYPRPHELLSSTVSEISKLLAKDTPPHKWVDEAIKYEKENDNRKGVLSELGKYIGASKQHDEDLDKQRKVMSVTPEYCRIAAMAYTVGNGEPQVRVLDQFNEKTGVKTTEKIMLMEFWKAVQFCTPIVGYNIKGFDLHVAFARSAILGVEPTIFINSSRYSADVIDLYEKRWGTRPPSNAPASLKAMCRMYGIEVPAGDVDGSQVEELYKSNPEAVGRYCASDVVITRELLFKTEGFWFSL